MERPSVVVPNEYADKELEEIFGQLGNQTKDRDRWLQRFYEVGGERGPRNESHAAAEEDSRLR